MLMISEIASFLIRDFPKPSELLQVVGARCVILQHEVRLAELRPVGTVSGPF